MLTGFGRSESRQDFRWHGARDAAKTETLDESRHEVFTVSDVAKVVKTFGPRRKLGSGVALPRRGVFNVD